MINPVQFLTYRKKLLYFSFLQKTSKNNNVLCHKAFLEVVFLAWIFQSRPRCNVHSVELKLTFASLRNFSVPIHW